MIWILPMAGNGKRTAALGKFKPLDRLKFLNTTHYIEL